MTNESDDGTISVCVCVPCSTHNVGFRIFFICFTGIDSYGAVLNTLYGSAHMVNLSRSDSRLEAKIGLMYKMNTLYNIQVQPSLRQRVYMWDEWLT